jgi:uncharacterized protein (DUF2236 family)
MARSCVTRARDVTVSHAGLDQLVRGLDHRAMSVVTRDQLEASLAVLRRTISDEREGILGPRSVAWQLGGDLGLFIGGGRAGLLQLAHPMVAHAIDHHSRTRDDVVGRFQRTFRNVFAMLYGDVQDAFAAARRVHAIHARITGVMDAIGSWPAGTPYHANDAAALRWVHATLVDTTLVVRELLDGPLPRDLGDRYVVEMNRFAALFGIPRELLPTDRAAHAAYMMDMLGSQQLAVAPCAREMARFLVGRDGGAQPPLGRITEAITHALLPPHLAAQFGLRPAPLRVRAGLGAFATVYRRLPRVVIAIPAASEARRRLAGQGPSRISAWTERRLFGLAHRATGA